MSRTWTPAEFVARFPHAYHMAEFGSWPSIKKYGLLSTSRLLAMFEVPEDRRTDLETRRRPNLVPLEHPQFGQVVLRDQKPLSEAKLAQCLTGGMTVSQWMRLLNAHTFFWVAQDRLSVLSGAAAYKGKRQLVLTVDTRSLLEECLDRAYLTDRNTGATNPFAHPRGPQTFVKLTECCRRRPVVELAIVEGVSNVVSHVVRVEELGGDEPIGLIFQA